MFDPRLTEEYQQACQPYVYQNADGEIAAMDIGASLWATAIQTSESGAAITKTRHIGCRWGYASLVYETDSVMFPQAKATGLTVKDWQDLIMVNQFGKRFWDEGDGSYKFFNAAMAYSGDKTKLNGGGPIWAIFDADGAAREKWNTKPPNVDPDGWFYQADTLAELAGRIKSQYQKQPMPGAALTETVARYNSFVTDGVDKDFKKKTPMHKIEKPPFYAAWATPILHDTLTGLRTNTSTEVVDMRGEVIPGLYLRGRIAGRLRPARPRALPGVRPHRRAARGEEHRLRRGWRSAEATLHQTSLAVWDIPPAIPAGERFSRQARRRSRLPAARSAAAASRCWMRPVRCWAPAASAMRRGQTRAGSTGPRSSWWRRRSRDGSRCWRGFEPAELEEPHDGTSSPFSVSVVSRAEHLLTVTVASGGRPVDEAYLRLGPYRATTDAAGVAAGQARQGRLRAGGVEGRIRHDADPARNRRGCRRSGRRPRAAGGRSRRGLDGLSGVL